MIHKLLKEAAEFQNLTKKYVRNFVASAQHISRAYCRLQNLATQGHVMEMIFKNFKSEVIKQAFPILVVKLPLPQNEKEKRMERWKRIEFNYYLSKIHKLMCP